MSTTFWRGWRFWILGCCVLLRVLFGLVWGFLPHRSAQGATPLQHSCLKVDMEHRDLGVVYPGDEVQLQYHLENTGESELTISDLSSSCGCAPATIDTTTIPFGGEATIKVHFQTPLAAGTVGH